LEASSIGISMSQTFGPAHPGLENTAQTWLIAQSQPGYEDFIMALTIELMINKDDKDGFLKFLLIAQHL
ncbi:UNVERIFIED_CONTAM: hypothetical protein K2H54_057249, partial [Gekko kuhli]